MISYYVFFFKQKTAYELRISDWSSDVCSSDLSMVDHLTSKIRYLERLIPLTTGDVVLDLGSNDCTTLKAYERNDIKRIGIDPTGKKVAEYYPVDVELVTEFFSAAVYKSVSSKPAKIITSIAMLYAMADPITFAKKNEQCLDDEDRNIYSMGKIIKV